MFSLQDSISNEQQHQHYFVKLKIQIKSLIKWRLAVIGNLNTRNFPGVITDIRFGQLGQFKIRTFWVMLCKFLVQKDFRRPCADPLLVHIDSSTVETVEFFFSAMLFVLQKTSAGPSLPAFETKIPEEPRFPAAILRIENLHTFYRETIENIMSSCITAVWESKCLRPGEPKADGEIGT